MRVATHNVLGRLSDYNAGFALEAVLAESPHIGGLQEWPLTRRDLLTPHGQVVRFPGTRRRFGLKQTDSGYVFGYPLTAGQPVFVDAAWGELLTVRARLLAKPRGGVRPTDGTEALVRVRATGQVIPVLNTHLMAHHDRPANLEAWRDGKAAVEKWARDWITQGYAPIVMGDMNKVGLDLERLVSCWAGNRVLPTFKTRAIDYVYATQRAQSVRVIDTPSDHRAVIADYKEKP